MPCRVRHDWRPLLLSWCTSLVLHQPCARVHSLWWRHRIPPVIHRPSFRCMSCTLWMNPNEEEAQVENSTSNNLLLLSSRMNHGNSEPQHQLFRTFLGKVPSLLIEDDATVLKVKQILDGFLNKYGDTEIDRPVALSILKGDLEIAIFAVTDIFLRMALQNSQLSTRQKMQRAAHSMFDRPQESIASSLLVAVLIVTALSVVPVSTKQNDAAVEETISASRAAASAIVSSLSPLLPSDWTIGKVPLVVEVIKAVFETLAILSPTTNCVTNCDINSEATNPFPIVNNNNNNNAMMAHAETLVRMDFHILRSLCQCLRIDSCVNESMARAVATVVTHSLSNDGPSESAPVLALAAQLRPWSKLDPTVLVHFAVQWGLWESAERICLSTMDDEMLALATMYILIDAVVSQRFYRKADRYVTLFYDIISQDAPGKLRFLNARYLHACSSIRKLIRRRAFPVIDRQVERVDLTVGKLNNLPPLVDGNTFSAVEQWDEVGTTMETAGTDIRTFTLEQLEYSGNIDAAHRLAKLWNMDYVLDEDVMQQHLRERKLKYIQWEDVFPNQSIPQLISSFDALDVAMQDLGSAPVYGFDVEWGNDEEESTNTGAAVLQIATLHGVLLLDIPALSSTVEGVNSLERNIGTLFRGPPSTVLVGFQCREDVSRLRKSPCVTTTHWFPQSSIVCDLQPLVKSKLSQSMGLSRCCEHFLKKPLDKSEQCSEWNQRPLSEPQRIYAALDAYVCACIYSEHFCAPSE